MPTKRSFPGQLAQRFLSTTADSLLYTCPSANTTTYVKNIFVCNIDSANHSFSLYVNQNGSATGNQFVLFKSVVVTANTTTIITLNGDNQGIVLGGAPASIIVSASQASTLTITLYGIEVVET